MQKKDYSLKSGERYSTLDLNLIGGDHLLRYKYAANRAKEIYASPYGADIFCGSGYGAEILAETTQGNILAIDGSLEAIENARDRKSTRLNSSHLVISYAVFCLKKKNIAASTSENNGYFLYIWIRTIFSIYYGRLSTRDAQIGYRYLSDWAHVYTDTCVVQ